MLWIKGRQPQAPVRLFDRIEFVALLQIEPGEQFLRQDHSNRIADLANLKDVAFREFAWHLVHVPSSCYTDCITGKFQLVQQTLYAQLGPVSIFYPIASSSSIMPAMTDSPPSQNVGSLASRPNGLSSSE